MLQQITEENFELYCAKAYDGKFLCSMEEFRSDIRRIIYIRKLITRFIQSGDLKERLILNHIIILNNVFGPYHTPRILYFKLSDKFEYVKPFLLMLNILPDVLTGVGEKPINTDCIPMNQGIVEALRKI